MTAPVSEPTVLVVDDEKNIRRSIEIALEQEIQRALRHKHALAVLLFDINDLSEIDREHGWGVGERLLERTGILARQYFRTHDWVARRGKAAIAVLLPETTLDQAA